MLRIRTAQLVKNTSRLNHWNLSGILLIHLTPTDSFYSITGWIWTALHPVDADVAVLSSFILFFLRFSSLLFRSFTAVLSYPQAYLRSQELFLFSFCAIRTLFPSSWYSTWFRPCLEKLLLARWRWTKRKNKSGFIVLYAILNTRYSLRIWLIRVFRA